MSTPNQPKSRAEVRKAVQAAKERAKALEVEQKAARKAAKERRKSSNDPSDMGPLRQIREAYKITKQFEPRLPWMLLGAFLLPAIIGLLIGLAINQPVLLTIFGLLVGLPLAMLVLVNRTKKATFKRFAGQAGSTEVALSMLPKKKWISTPAITANKSMDSVHRTVGPAGIVLIGEGEPGRVRQLLASEAKKHEKVVYEVPVTTIVMGDREGLVPLDRLADHIKKLPKKLEPHEVTEVTSRLKALDAVRPKLPMPKGPVPTSMKGLRQGMRGR
ncbi:F0F1-type ATP synthase assembly protein I [Naumannella cuiyingiana]|uniref:F0F1-type ATP synthase assembly protein I n=1 Tax=Naumannella cuiyingiana TaxID=1347891 RepID=A0A7Z0DB01_9ACTN|nr:DUF4191 domain-containing protein [Naumannella cuiyingiana]NYI72009.1 F0F1-type ATP synthase assembly protein I [Naumannella cuiyingiana]